MSTRIRRREDDRARELRLEQRAPLPVREDPNVTDLRRVIHLLAMAMTDGKAVA